MLFSRHVRRCVIGLLWASMLFAQLAVAGHVCPLQRPQSSQGAEHSAMADMPCAEMMSGAQAVDADPPGLCFKHCQIDAAQAAVDLSPFAVLALPALLTVVVLPAASTAEAEPRQWASHQRQRDRAPPDDHSIVHCCWRL